MAVTDGAPAPADDIEDAEIDAADPPVTREITKETARGRVKTMRVIVAPNRTVTAGDGKVHHPGAELDLPLADAALVLENGFAVKPGSKVEQRPLPGQRDDTK